jgi:iron complex outermembrane receptor protein
MRNLLLFLFIILTKSVVAAEFSSTQLSGRVLDNERKPVEYAVVTLLKAEDSTLVKGAESGADGSFVLDGFAGGNYLLNVSFSGYMKQMLGPMAITEGENKKLPDIILDPSKEISEVTIVATQPLFSHKPGMLIMNVENSPVQISGTAYDVVSKAPGVTVDQDGNFSLLGKSGVKIYIDNKPTYLSGDQLKTMLQGMPGGQIVRVEIMSNPPAKYDAEGSAGIINIVTKQGTQQGFNGTASGGFGYGLTYKTEASLSLNYGQPKSNFYMRYDFTAPSRVEYKYLTRNVHFAGGTTRYVQDIDLLFKPVSNHARIGADFSPTKKIHWGVRADGTLIHSYTNIDARNNVTDVDSGSTAVLHQVNTLLGNFNNGSVGAYYTQKFDTAGTELSASADYVTYDNSAHEKYDLHFFDDQGNEIAPPAFQRTEKQSLINIYVAQLDFVHPFSKKYSFETGIKASFVKTSNDLLFELQDNASGNWNTDSTRTNSFFYDELISAAYISCSADYGKWQIKGGLRAEQTYSFGESPTTGTDHKNNYLQLFPTLFVTEKLNDKNTLDYSFSRRINRPEYNDLNPFIFYIDQYTYRLGNPYLQPEIANAADITHDYADMLFTSIGVSRTTNGFGQMLRQNDTTGIVKQSTVNLNTIDNAYLNVTLSMPFTKWWINEANAGVNYDHYINKTEGSLLDRSGITYNFSLKETFLLAHGWKLEASGWYQGPTTYSIFSIQPSGDISFGLSKNFFENKLRCSLSVADVFYTESQKLTIVYDNQDLYSLHDFDSRVAYLRVRYNFGNSAAARKSQFQSGADELKKRA